MVSPKSKSVALAGGAVGNAPPVGGGGDGIEEACTLPIPCLKCVYDEV